MRKKCPSFHYLTEEESKMPLEFALGQICLGLQTCKTKGEVIELLKDAYLLGKRDDRQNILNALKNHMPDDFHNGYIDFSSKQWDELMELLNA